MALSAAGKLMLAMCICPVIATPVVHKPTRDKIAKVAGYKPIKEKEEEVPCVDTSSIDGNPLGTGYMTLEDIPGLYIIPNHNNVVPNDGQNPIDPYPYGPIYNPPTGTINPPGSETIPVSTPATATLIASGIGLIGFGIKKKK